MNLADGDRLAERVAIAPRLHPVLVAPRVQRLGDARGICRRPLHGEGEGIGLEAKRAIAGLDLVLVERTRLELRHEELEDTETHRCSASERRCHPTGRNPRLRSRAAPREPTPRKRRRRRRRSGAGVRRAPATAADEYPPRRDGDRARRYCRGSGRDPPDPRCCRRQSESAADSAAASRLRKGNRRTAPGCPPAASGPRRIPPAPARQRSRRRGRHAPRRPCTPRGRPHGAPGSAADGRARQLPGAPRRPPRPPASRPGKIVPPRSRSW